MPLIQVKLIKRVFTQAQSRETVRKLADAMASLQEKAASSITWIVIEETRSEEWDIGEQTITADKVPDLAAGRK